MSKCRKKNIVIDKEDFGFEDVLSEEGIFFGAALGNCVSTFYFCNEALNEDDLGKN